MCVKNYENIKDLKAAIISVFQEVSDGMVTSTMGNFGTRELNMNLSDVPNLQSGYCRQGIAYRGPKIRIYIRSEFARVTGFR